MNQPASIAMGFVAVVVTTNGLSVVYVDVFISDVFMSPLQKRHVTE